MMHVVIAKVDEVFFDGEAYSLTVPGSEGQMTVLGEHMPLVTTLKAGDIILREERGGESRVFQIESGVLEVRRDGATVIL
jgi:F-type H+-transporting ATPase subunit epsilon